MATAAEKLEWCAAHYTKGGQPFTIEGREWVRDEFFRPLGSWKLWPRDPAAACEECLSRAGEFAEWSPELIRSLAAHAKRKTGCAGLEAHPVMVMVLNLQRGAGKTINTAALILSTLDLEESVSVGFVASAKSQSVTLLAENFVDPISSNRRLAKTFEVVGDRLFRRRKKRGADSFLELVATSHGSITGRRRDILFIDEARDVEARTFAALLPSIKAKSRLECPRKHASRPYVPGKIEKCPTCKTVMQPHIPRVVITSTSGVIEGGEHDWFNELVESLEQEPSPWAHLYRSDKAANPNISSAETDMLQGVFGDIPSLAQYMDVELHNVARRKGEDFVTVSQVAQILDADLENLAGSHRPCVGYLDTSRVGDLTSLVIVGQDDERSPVESPWKYVRLDHLKTWDPKDPRQCPKGRVERDHVEGYLVELVPMFPGLKRLDVDVRGKMQWAIDMVDDLRAGRVDGAGSWGRRIFKHAYGQTVERDAAWALFEAWLVDRRFRAFPHPLIRAELLGVRRHIRPDNTVEIRDRNRKLRHAEVIEGLAWCAKRIHEMMLKPRPTVAEVNSGKVGDALKNLFGGGKSLTGGLSASDF